MKKLHLLTSTEISSEVEAIVTQIRMPRIFGTAATGAMLSIAGVALQGIFRNPLADPTVAGISSGAAFAAALSIVFLGSLSIGLITTTGITILSVATFIGAILTAIVVFTLSREKEKTNVQRMLLTGIAMNAILSAAMGLLIYIADDSQLRTITFWMLGSMGGITWSNANILLIALVATWIPLSRMHKSLNAMTLGEQEASYIGENTEKLKTVVIITVAIAVGITVAFCGMIGFVGLAVPHIVRLMGGSNHRYLLPVSALFGAILLCISDNVARTLSAPAEIPIGIITSFIGAPIFLSLVLKQKNMAA